MSTGFQLYRFVMIQHFAINKINDTDQSSDSVWLPDSQCSHTASCPANWNGIEMIVVADGVEIAKAMAMEGEDLSVG